MFVFFSKLTWLFVAPTGLMMLLFCVGSLLFILKRTRSFGIKLTSIGSIIFFSITFLSLGDALIIPLEYRFAPLETQRIEKCSPVSGIVLLGGSTETHVHQGKRLDDLTESADRIRYAATLWRSHPDLKIIVSGGQVFAKDGQSSEADVTTKLLTELGVDQSKIIIEDQSRTTFENATYSARVIKSMKDVSDGNWILVTSAFHMPRSVGVFLAQGISVVPAPTDFRIDESELWLERSVSRNLIRLDLATKEYIGLIAYRLTGRSQILFPGPEHLKCY